MKVRRTGHCWRAVTWRHLYNISERKKPTADGTVGLVSFPSTQEHYWWACYTSLGEGLQRPRKRMAGWRIKPDLFHCLQQRRMFRYFQGNSKDLAVGLRWLRVYLKEESRGCLRIARRQLTGRPSSCPRALPILKAPLGAIVWAWPDCQEVQWAQPLAGTAEHALVAHWE